MSLLNHVMYEGRILSSHGQGSHGQGSTPLGGERQNFVRPAGITVTLDNDIRKLPGLWAPTTLKQMEFPILKQPFRCEVDQGGDSRAPQSMPQQSPWGSTLLKVFACCRSSPHWAGCSLSVLALPSTWCWPCLGWALFSSPWPHR